MPARKPRQPSPKSGRGARREADEAEQAAAEERTAALRLLDPSGGVLASSTGGIKNAENLQIFKRAYAGTTSAARELWPDDNEYFSSLIVDTSYGTLPGFGWRMIGRVAPDTVFRGLNCIIVELALVLTAALLGFLAIAYLYYRIILHPISRLGESAFRVVDGEELPPHAGTTREASRLAAALLAKL